MSYDPPRIARPASVLGTRFQFFELSESFAKDTDNDEKMPHANAKRLSYSESEWSVAEPECECELWLPPADEAGQSFEPMQAGDRVWCWMNPATGHWQPLGPPVSSPFRIRNDTGQDLVSGNIVGIGDLVESDEEDYPAFYWYDFDEDATTSQSTSITMAGVLPESPTHRGAFAVLTADLAAGATGPAVTTGVAKCTVDFGKFPQCMFAEIDCDAPTVESLTAYPVGSAQILSHTDSECVVKLGNASARTFPGVMAGTLTMGGTAKCNVMIDGGQVTVEVSASTRLLLSTDSPLAAGTEVEVASEVDGTFRVIAAQCPTDEGDAEESGE